MVILLQNIRSAYNVGSIFRTSDAVGIEKIYLCGITPDPIDKFGRPQKEIQKVSLGACDFVPWKHIKSISLFINKLKKENYKIIALEQSSKSTPYNRIKLPLKSKTALILGTEVTGLPKNILEKSDIIAEIPMHGKKESLNVSVAFGIIAYSLIGQKE